MKKSVTATLGAGLGAAAGYYFSGRKPTWLTDEQWKHVQGESIFTPQTEKNIGAGIGATTGLIIGWLMGNKR